MQISDRSTRILKCLAPARVGMLFIPTSDLQGIDQPQFRTNLRSLEIETRLAVADLRH